MIKYNFVILASTPETGASYNINKAINIYTEHTSNLLVLKKPPYRKNLRGYYNINNESDNFQIDQLFKQDNLILFHIGIYSFSILEKYGRKVNALHRCFYWTDTGYIQNYKTVNYYLNMLKRKTIFTMPDLVKYTENSIPLLQPMDFRYKEKKYSEFTVCHSPGAKGDTDEKGTQLIKDVVNELKMNFSLIENMSNNECLIEKAKCHVFIDKISKHSAGVGKSGLESVYMGIPTICSMSDFHYKGIYKIIPIIEIETQDKLKKILLKLKIDTGYYEYIAKRTKNWSTNLDMENTVKYIMENIHVN